MLQELGDYLKLRWKDNLHNANESDIHIYGSYPYLYSVGSFGIIETGAINLWKSMTTNTYATREIIEHIVFRKAHMSDYTFDPTDKIWRDIWRRG